MTQRNLDRLEAKRAAKYLARQPCACGWEPEPPPLKMRKHCQKCHETFHAVGALNDHLGPRDNRCIDPDSSGWFVAVGRTSAGKPVWARRGTPERERDERSAKVAQRRVNGLS